MGQRLEAVMEKLDQGYTARQLIEQLKQCDPDAKVVFACDYGDYHHTTQALPVCEVYDASTSDIATTAYSNSGLKVLDDEDDRRDREDDDDGEVFTVIVLRQ